MIKATIAKFGEAEVGTEDCKYTIRQLIDSGWCVYRYSGGSVIALPEQEGGTSGSPG